MYIGGYLPVQPCMEKFGKIPEVGTAYESHRFESITPFFMPFLQFSHNLCRICLAGHFGALFSSADCYITIQQQPPVSMKPQLRFRSKRIDLYSVGGRDVI